MTAPPAPDLLSSNPDLRLAAGGRSRAPMSRRVRRFALACGLLAAGLGLTVLLGHGLAAADRVTPLTTLGVDSTPTRTGTAVAFVLLGGALALHTRRPRRRLLVPGLALLLLAWAGLELVEFAVVRAGKGEALADVPVLGQLFAVIRATSISAGSAIGLLLTSLSLYCLSTRPGRRRTVVGVAAAVLAGAKYLMFLWGFVHRRQLFSDLLGVGTPFPTALTYLVLSAGLIAAAGPRIVSLSRFVGDPTTARLLRAFLPIILGLLFVGEVVRVRVLQSNTSKFVWTYDSEKELLDDLALSDEAWAKKAAEKNRMRLIPVGRKVMRVGRSDELDPDELRAWAADLGTYTPEQLATLKQNLPSKRFGDSVVRQAAGGGAADGSDSYWTISAPKDYDLWLAAEGLSVFAVALVLSAAFFVVARWVGRSLEQARAALTRTLDDLRAARDRAEQAAVSRDLFLAQVSHELRTPLNHILGFCQLLEFTDLDDAQQQDLHKINRAGNHLLALINDILDYQKIIMGKIPLEPEDFDVEPWAREVAEGMAPKVQEKGNQLVVDCAPDVGGVRADRQRCRQVLTNLLSNAAKFTRNGRVTIAARREVVADKDWVVVSVTDTGKGIDAAGLAKLFRPFGQLTDKKDNPEGTGLGLAISKTLLEQMGGDIGVSSVVGQGTTFFFRLPALPPPETPSQLRRAALIHAPAAAPAAPPPAERGDCPILVIDDDPQVGELMRRFLEKRGYTIHVATTGVQALELVKALHPAVITLDVLMPGLDGWGVLAALKTDAELADIPVIIMSIVEDHNRGFLLGANDYVPKPIDWDRLTALLEKYRTPAGGSILLVEDDPEMRELCRRALEPVGWRVVEAADGAAGLKRLAQRPPDLILLDLMLPVLDGFEFLDEVRRRPEWRSIPVVVLTARELSAADRQRLSGGVQDIVQKARRTPDELRDAIVADVERFAGARRPGPKELTRA